MAATWGQTLPLGPASTGLHVVGWLPVGRDDRTLAESVGSPGMAVFPLPHDDAGPARRPGLLLWYGAASEAGVRQTVSRPGELPEPKRW